MPYPKLIDNIRVGLKDTLRQIAPFHKKISIATGYWDLAGTAEIIDLLEQYDSIRLLIGQEPLSYRYQKFLKIDLEHPDHLFPDADFKKDLEKDARTPKDVLLRETAIKIAKLIETGKLEVKVYKKATLHAKAYVFGDYTSDNSIGILGSSNFTHAGLNTNTELNSLEDDYMIVNYQPASESQQNGYLSWFDGLWSDPEAVDWTGEFKALIQDSPVGNITYGPYDSYIKTLMEVYPDELLPQVEIKGDIADVLYEFQNRNAGILIRKLEHEGIAILADSVGLGKTITGGAVIKHYLEKTNDKANILIIAPAALKQQWKDDLASVLGIDYLDGAYQIVSQQDSAAIDEIYEEYKKNWRRHRNLDLIVIDEAHNLRASAGRRHDAILNLLQQHPDSHVLLLTATPVNNSLMDIANIIQLASKGRLTSVNVSYPRPDGSTDQVDFYTALKLVQSQIRRAEKEGGDIEAILDTYKPTIHEGLRHYLVRSTRQGVEAEGGIIDRKTGLKRAFPESAVTSIDYAYDDEIVNYLYDAIGSHVMDTFEGLDPRRLNLDLMTEFTQQTQHPLDFINEALMDSGKLAERFNTANEDFSGKELYTGEMVKDLVPNLLQVVFAMGFTPYRPDVYMHAYWGKTVSDIQAIKNVPEQVKVQLAVHNILQVTWLKRMESSAAALLNSVINYEKRLALFEKYVDKGYIIKLEDASLLESDYSDGSDVDLDQAFADFDKYLQAREELLEKGLDPSVLKKQGVEKKPADPKIYNIKQLKLDLAREKRIIALLKGVLAEIIKPEHDTKARHLSEEIKKVLESGKYGKKVLVFSFFADTVNYLRDNGAALFSGLDPDFASHAEFISGQNSGVERITRRFSPISKHYEFQEGESELDFLFSTDVLSEGQNLQDAGYLINYDLHWNPVRMIQRNGRINRLGSSYEEVLISNMKPMSQLDMYLKLVNRLERKIKTIRNTIGLDQGVLATSDVNPIDFIEKYYTDGTLPEEEDILAHTDEHIIELRKFLGVNPVGSEGYERVYNMPEGKWNYLPVTTNLKGVGLSMMRILGEYVASKRPFTDLYFIRLSQNNGELVATYVDSTTALDAIKTVPEDNQRVPDAIKIDRQKAWKRVSAESKRQSENPENSYSLKPSYVNALLIIKEYLSEPIASEDIVGTIEKGVTTTDQKEGLEKILRKINKEQKDNGSLFSDTIGAFTKIYLEIRSNVGEDKQVDDTTGVLYYAKH